jgi:hypothetical protein
MISFVLEFLQALPSLVKAGVDVYAQLTSVNATLALMQKDNRGPTDQEWALLRQMITDLNSELN